MTEYQKYQLQWMIDHDHSIQDLIQELRDYQYDDPEDSDRISTPIDELFSEWEQDIGFGSEIWACQEEWNECENKQHKSKRRKYKLAKSVSVGDVVMTQDGFDIGLVLETRRGKPTKIASRWSLYGGEVKGCPCYGGIDSVDWYKTGINMTLDKWISISKSISDSVKWYEYFRHELIGIT